MIQGLNGWDSEERNLFTLFLHQQGQWFWLYHKVQNMSALDDDFAAKELPQSVR